MKLDKTGQVSLVGGTVKIRTVTGRARVTLALVKVPLKKTYVGLITVWGVDGRLVGVTPIASSDIAYDGSVLSGSASWRTYGRGSSGSYSVGWRLPAVLGR